MTDKIPPVAKFAVLLAAVVAVTGCSSARQQSAAPTTAQATKPAPRRQAPPKPRIVRGFQYFVNANRIQNEASAPVVSGKYGPR